MNRSLVSLLVAMTVSSLSLSAADWPMFGRDATHAAATGASAPHNLNAAPHRASPALGIKPGSAPIIADGRVYVYSAGATGMLFCLDAATLSLIWSNAIPVEDDGWGSWATPAVAQGYVVFGADDFLGCWSTNGVPQWTADITKTMNSSPVIAGDIVLMGGFHYANAVDAVAAFSLTNGARLWINSNVPVATSSCTPAVNGGIGYACSGSNVWAFDCATGTNLWNVALPCTSLKNVSLGSNTVLAVNYDVFASGPRSNLFTLDAANGALRWARVCGGSDVPPAVWGTIAVFSCGDNATATGLTAFDLFSGTQLWTRTDVGNSGNMPAIADGVVYAGAGVYDAFWTFVFMTNFSAVSVADGTLLSRVTTDGGHSAAIAGDALFSANNGVLYRYSWLTVSQIKAKVLVAGGVKDSISLSASTLAPPSVTNIGTEPVTLSCGGVNFITSVMGDMKWNGTTFKWQFKDEGLRVKLAWSAKKQILTVNAKLSKTTLAGSLPYGVGDGVETNTVSTTLSTLSGYQVESSDAVPATTKNGTATLKYKNKMRFAGSFIALLVATLPCAGMTNAPQRIVSFSPALTEVLFAIGAGGRVTGVADFCAYPVEAATRAHVGGIANPNLELILSLKPDLVLLQGEMDLMRRFCAQHAIPTRAVELDTWTTITNGIVVVGELTACRSRAEALVADMARRWAAVRTRGAARPSISAFICIGREAGPVASSMTATASSFLVEALAVAGGTNICADAKGYYPTISTEVLTARQPRLIFDLRPGERIDAAHRTRLEREWAPVHSAGSMTVHVLTNDYLLIAGPRIIETAELFARLLHPSEQP